MASTSDEEVYETKIVEILQNLYLKYKDGSVIPTRDYRQALDRYGYTFKETIGMGTFSKVKLAYCDKLHRDVAVKVIHKTALTREAEDVFLPREIALMQKLRHTSLPAVHEVYETRSNLYIVMEYLPNGDLLEYINEAGNLSEADARRLFHQLLDVVNYLHVQHVYHRDIKLDNILLDQYFNIRLTDFGFSRFNPKDDLLSTFCGSYAYAAPEILDGEPYNGAAADTWSTGVCLYGMLNGKLPYREDDVDILRNTMDVKLKFYKQVSKDCRWLVRSILTINAKERLSIPDIRCSDWMCKPIKNNNAMSMSAVSTKAVLTETQDVSLDPTVEHGFSCGQNTKVANSTKVTDILRSVAVNHSTGTSSVSLREILPVDKVSSTAMALGVKGPAGRRISVQIGATEMGSLLSGHKKPLSTISETPGSKDSNVKWAAALTGAGEEPPAKMAATSGLSKFKKAATALNKFKTAVRVVTAMKKFKRGPLTTILTIPQEQAMAKVINAREEEKELEMKDIKHSSSSKVAGMLGTNRRRKSDERRATLALLETTQRAQEEKLEKFGDTFSHLVPQ